MNDRITEQGSSADLLRQAENAQFETRPDDMLGKCIQDYEALQDQLPLNGGLLGTEKSLFDF